MVNIKAITNLATLGLAGYIFIKVWPTVQSALGGLGGGGQLMIEGTPPLTGEETQAIFRTELARLEATRAEVARETVPQIAAASVIPGTPIGVGQQEFAVPDVSAQLAAMQQPAPPLTPPVVPQPKEIPFAPVGSIPLGIGLLPPRPAIVAAPAPPLPDYTQPSQFVSVGQASVPIASAGWEAGRIVGHRFTGGQEFNIIATGTGFETRKVLV